MSIQRNTGTHRRSGGRSKHDTIAYNITMLYRVSGVLFTLFGGLIGSQLGAVGAVVLGILAGVSWLLVAYIPYQMAMLLIDIAKDIRTQTQDGQRAA